METLRDFPKSGVCWYKRQDLTNYLKSKNLRQSNVGSPSSTGIAWNSFSYWTVIGHSGQPEYTIEQLRPFFPKPEHLSWCPVVPDECYTPVKFCLRITTDNAGLIKDYMLQHQDAYEGWQDSWNPLEALGLYFCCPQETKDCYADIKPPKGYFQITNDSFLKHVLTHTDKQQIINPKTQENGQHQEREGGISLKVQRSNLTIRDTSPIRASGIKCAKSKIQIRDGHSPN
jgi:hypothetical protein